jgi:hypothetical protein
MVVVSCAGCAALGAPANGIDVIFVVGSLVVNVVLD